MKADVWIRKRPSRLRLGLPNTDRMRIGSSNVTLSRSQRLPRMNQEATFSPALYGSHNSYVDLRKLFLPQLMEHVSVCIEIDPVYP